MRLVVFLVLTLTCTSHAAFNEVFNEVGGSFAGVDVAGNYAIVSDNLYDGPGGSNQVGSSQHFSRHQKLNKTRSRPPAALLFLFFRLFSTLQSRSRFLRFC